jgi:hypothetical protein
MLGRHNCYRFLRNWFVLPSTHTSEAAPANSTPEKGNTLFARWPQAALDNTAFRNERFDPPHRQIIPLVGDAAVEPGLYEWPAGRFVGYSAVKGPITARLNALYARWLDDLAGALGKNWFTRWLARVGIGVVERIFGIRRRVLAALEKAVEDARRKIDQDSPAA